MVWGNLEEANEYFVQIGMGQSLIERSADVLTRMLRFMPENPEYLFVSEYRDTEGVRNYENLWLVSESFMSEAHQFIVSNEIDLTRADDGIVRVVVQNDEFEFEDASENSRLQVDFNLTLAGAAGISGSMRASGANCGDLSEILSKYLLPLMSRGEAESNI